jgi:glycerol-1-phosphate dehydrogenase [NAD(P)+]
MSQLQELLGCDFVCDQCGREHKNGLLKVCFAADALASLPSLCQEYGGQRVCVISDTRTREVVGKQVVELLAAAGCCVVELHVPDPAPDHVPVCDDVTHDALAPQLPEADIYVAAGSGVVSDLTKWLTGDIDKPYICVPTAASMNGYASANVAPTLKGVKSLVRGNGPIAIVGTPGILANAPKVMTAAGLGDVLAKPVSSSDWRLNRLVFDEYYCPFCAGTIDDIEPIYMDNPEAIGAGDEPGITALFEALTLTGISMTIAGTSSPASGGEHLISHTLDMMSSVDGIPHDFHGRQVGVSTILGAALYEELMALENPAFAVPESTFDPEFWGFLAPSVEEYHTKKRARCEAAVAAFRERPGLWDQVRATLSPELRSAARIKECLRRAGAAHRYTDLGIDRDRYLAAFHHAHEIRERFTVIDLARIVGILPSRAEELVDRWLSE